MLSVVCHWNKARKCDNGLMCCGCQYQPPDDEKPNGRKPLVKLRWVPQFNGMTDGFQPAPECPACGEMPYSTERCVFCGQRFLPGEV